MLNFVITFLKLCEEDFVSFCAEATDWVNISVLPFSHEFRAELTHQYSNNKEELKRLVTSTHGCNQGSLGLFMTFSCKSL